MNNEHCSNCRFYSEYKEGESAQRNPEPWHPTGFCNWKNPMRPKNPPPRVHRDTWCINWELNKALEVAPEETKEVLIINMQKDDIIISTRILNELLGALLLGRQYVEDLYTKKMTKAKRAGRISANRFAIEQGAAERIEKDLKALDKIAEEIKEFLLAKKKSEGSGITEPDSNAPDDASK